VLVPASTPFTEAPGSAADAGVNVQPVLHALAEIGFGNDGLVPLLFVADAGDWLEVETPGIVMGDGLFCVPLAADYSDAWRHLLEYYRLRGFVPRSAALPVLRERVHLDFADGSEAILEPGLPAEPKGGADGGSQFHFKGPVAHEPGNWECGEHGFGLVREFDLPVDAGTFGADFEQPSTYLLRAKDGRWELAPWVRTAKLALGRLSFMEDEGDFIDRDVKPKGRSVVLALRDRCDTLKVVLPRSAVRHVDEGAGGVAGGCIVDHWGGAPRMPYRWLVSAGVQVFWPDGKLAGRTTHEDTFATEPQPRGEKECFDDRRGLLPTRPLCFDVSDVLSAEVGGVGGRPVPACVAGRPTPTSARALVLPTWAEVPEDVTVDCDVAPDGRPSCCDLPPMVDKQEAKVRLALDLKRIEPRVADAGVRRMRLTVVAGEL
jgi:hypothetical protein